MERLVLLLLMVLALVLLLLRGGLVVHGFWRN